MPILWKFFMGMIPRSIPTQCAPTSNLTLHICDQTRSTLVFPWVSKNRFWPVSKRNIRARKYVDDKGVKHYEIFGPLFFASVSAFNEKFDVANDPQEVIIDFAESRVVDMSGIEALNKITERYNVAGKRLHLKHLSPDCRQLLKNAEKIDVNIIEDPTYHLVVDKLA